MQMYAQTEFNFEQPYIWVLKMKHNIQITEPAWGHDRFFLHLLCHNFDTKKNNHNSSEIISQPSAVARIGSNFLTC